MLGLGYEETLYMNWSINLNKTVVWLKEIFAHSVFSPDVYMGANAYGPMILFGSYRSVMKWAVIVLLIIMASSGVLYIKTLIKQSDVRKKGYGIALFVALVFNMMLHYIYGSEEAFMYTPHYLFILFIIIAIGINSIKTAKIRIFHITCLWVLVLVEIVNNVYQEIVTANMALSSAGVAISWLKVAEGTIICAIVSYTLCLFFESKQTNSKTLGIGTTHEFDFMLRSIMIYSGVVLLCGLFISFNYGGGLLSFFRYYLNEYAQIISQLQKI